MPSRLTSMMSRRVALAAVGTLLLTGCGGAGSNGGAAPVTSAARAASEVPVARATSAGQTASVMPAVATPRDITSDVHSVRAAKARATALLDRLQLPTGSTRVAAAPVPLLTEGRDPGQHELPVADLTRWWTVPGDPELVIAALKAHPPAGLIVLGEHAEDNTHYVDFFPAVENGFGCECYPFTGNILAVVVTNDGLGAAVRADGQVLWRPPRSAIETIPAGVDTVTLAVGAAAAQSNQPATPAASGTVHGPAVRRLVTLLNSLQPFSLQGNPGCSAGGPRVSVVFPMGAHHVLAFRWVDPDCGRIDVTYDGSPQIKLAGTPLPEVRSLLARAKKP